MSQTFLQLKNISFSYPGASSALFANLDVQLEPGWTGLVGGNGTGKTTLLKLITAELKPDKGFIYRPGFAIYCAQETEYPPVGAEEFIASQTKESFILRERFSVLPDWLSKWTLLSHGERKRLQLATAFWKDPAILALDEPTNHLDRDTRAIIRDALHQFKGVGLIVSHDRQLLDDLCHHCIITEPPDINVRSGGYTDSMKIHRHEKESEAKEYRQKKKELQKLQKQLRQRHEKTMGADRRRSKRGIARKDHDAREKADRARISGKDATAGKLKDQMRGRLEQAQKKLAQLSFHKTCETGIWLPTSYSNRKRLIELQEGYLKLSPEKRLLYPELIIGPKDRIGITGPNGSGKSTLIRLLYEKFNLPEQHVTYLPQEIESEASSCMVERIRKLPPAQLGFVYTVINRLGTDPKRLMESETPSPGELRKIVLALGILQEPHVIIMDEPTNHMDIISVSALEEALSDCPCCLILVSHDLVFLDNLVNTLWEIEQTDLTSKDYHLQMKLN
jgi:ATPase subunit of ABC transporter with duplicated ATPase domains